jgi:hypothetical protein
MMLSDVNSPGQTAAYLRTLPAIRERCGRVHALAQRGKLEYFEYHPEKEEEVAKFCVGLMNVRMLCRLVLRLFITGHRETSVISLRCVHATRYELRREIDSFSRSHLMVAGATSTPDARASHRSSPSGLHRRRPQISSRSRAACSISSWFPSC